MEQYLSGYFLSNKISDQSPRCPAFEVYTLDNIPTEQDELRAWFNNSRTFWFSTLEVDWELIYRSDYLYFSDYRDVYKLLVSLQQFQQNSRTSGYANVDHAAFAEVGWCFWDRSLIPIFPPLLKRMEEKLAQQRQTIYTAMISKRKRSSKTFKRMLSLQGGIEKDKFIFDRLQVEFEPDDSLHRHDTRWTKFFPVITLKQSERQPSSLLDNLIRYIKDYEQLLNKQFTLLQNSVSEYLTMRNMEVSYKLQRNMWILTIIMAILTILVAKSDLKSLWISISQFLKNLF